MKRKILLVCLSAILSLCSIGCCTGDKSGTSSDYSHQNYRPLQWEDDPQAWPHNRPEFESKDSWTYRLGWYLDGGPNRSPR